MTKKKVTKKKPVVSKKPAPKKQIVRKSNPNNPKRIIKEVVTTEEKTSDGYWTKVTTVKYIKQLLCPAFVSDKVILYLAAIPLIFLILAVLWKFTSHE